MISFALFSLAVVVSLGAALYFSIGWKQAERRAQTAEKAYAELRAQWDTREQDLLGSIRFLKSNASSTNAIITAIQNELTASRHNADLLAAIVRQYVKDIRETMALLKDETPPKELVAAEEALRLHDEQVKLRNQT